MYVEERFSGFFERNPLTILLILQLNVWIDKFQEKKTLKMFLYQKCNFQEMGIFIYILWKKRKNKINGSTACGPHLRASSAIIDPPLFHFYYAEEKTWDTNGTEGVSSSNTIPYRVWTIHPPNRRKKNIYQNIAEAQKIIKESF